ncbi:MAG: type IX secretion system sortase PorU [Flavobacteriales bacterium]|nr:type IX secretion system sortase PorU [Flavobacteriales bacterium]
MLKKYLFQLALQLLFISSFAGKINLTWSGISVEKTSEYESHKYLSFSGAHFQDDLPMYHQKIAVQLNDKVSWYIENETYEDLSTAEEKLIDSKGIGNTIEISEDIGYYRKAPFAIASFVPIRKKSNSSGYEKLISFDLNYTIESRAFQKSIQKAINIQKSFTNSSVLATGEWFQFKLDKYGIYKLDYSYLKTKGVDVDKIDPRNLQIFGYGGGMLPESNSAKRIDDLNENAIYVDGENDGVFNSGDYILFYGEGPHKWTYDTTDQHYKHKNHHFSDYSYYYLTVSTSGFGKRVNSVSSTTEDATNSVNTFDEHLFVDNDNSNLIKSGKEWYGEIFDVATSYSFSFSTPNIDNSVLGFIKIHAIARATQTSTYTVSINNSNTQYIGIDPINKAYTQAFYKGDILETTFTPKSTNTIRIDYAKSTVAGVGWLNYIELQVRRKLKLYGNQMAFRDVFSVGEGNISEFTLSGANSSTKIWDVTDPANVFVQEAELTGSELVFRTETDSLKQFVALGTSGFLTPTFVKELVNQNLHGLSQYDYIIVAHPTFLSAANTLADFHREESDLSVFVVTPQQVYQEFSSGAQDISAIRDFMRMFYERATDESDLPKYLLLFGDGSYDNKNRLAGNTNFIPTYQSAESKEPTKSYVSDDYYGLLDSTEGVWRSGAKHYLDIGIGRIPCKDLAEANGVVNKIINYTRPVSQGDWRNGITFIADDEDGNLHATHSNIVANSVVDSNKNYNMDKIFFDAYFQVNTSAGQRYPDVKKAINNAVSKGQLIVNYTGHGGELGWAHERVLEVSDINNWTNINSLPLFVTATCEFSRWDDPGRVSAGEHVLLNSDGGGIALMTTTRLVYASQNFTLSKYLYAEMFEKENNEYQRIGDIFRLAKFENGSPSNNSRNFCLLGDPAVTLTYPKDDIVTTDIKVNGSSSATQDTLTALSEIEIIGEIRNQNGVKKSSYNGTLYTTVFDKSVTLSTLGNDGGSKKYFSVQKSILFKGKASVKNGEFSFKFVIPKDIGYQFGTGKISYYAADGVTDANGSKADFIIGGTNLNAVLDENGPEIELYLNDENFAIGGTTDENPYIVANISDNDGINTVGNGIGHDITAIIDEKSENPIILNDFYESDLDSYKSGSVKYQLTDLDEGKHTLTIKVWDVQNNSSSATTEFVVANSEEMEISHVLNYPNPFTTNTSFFFEHNQPQNQLEVQIQIFSLAGNLVRTINQYVTTSGYRSEGISWDGLNEYGEKLGRGVYMYRLKVDDGDGLTADKYERLVIL